jgi:predicted nucleic acid-binding protein
LTTGQPAEKEQLANVLAEHEVAISTKLLIKLRSVVSRKLLSPLWLTQSHDLLEALSGFEVIPIDENLDIDADRLAFTEHLSWFDALIADFGHGRTIQDLQVISPHLGISPTSSGGAA